MKRTPDDVRQALWNYLHRKKSKIALDLWWLVSALVILDKCGLLGGAPDRSTEPSELGEAFAKLFPKSNTPTRNLSLLLKSEVVQLLASYENTGHPLGAIPGALRKISLPKEALKAVNFLNQKGPEVEAPLDLDSIWATITEFMNRIAFDSHESYYSDDRIDDLIASSLAHAKSTSVIDLCACSGQTAAAFAGPDTELGLLTENAGTGIVAVARVLVAGQSVGRLKIHVGHPTEIQVVNRKWDVVIAAPALWPDERPDSVANFDLGYLEAAMDLVAKGGKAVVHLPLSVLSGKKSQKLRQRLLEDYRIDCLIHGDIENENEVIEDSTLLFFTKTRSSLRTQMIDSWTFYQVFDSWGSYKPTKCGFILKNCFIAAVQTFLGVGLEASASAFKTKRHELLKNLARQAGNLLEELELSTVPSDNLAYDVDAATAGLKLVKQAIKCIDGHNDPTDEASYKEQPFVAEIIARGYDLCYSRTSVADYERFLDQAEKKHGAQILTLDQIGVIRSGINCPTSHLTKKGSPTQDAESRVVRVVTARNDRGSNNRQLELIDLETTLVPEVAVALSDDELLRDGDLLVALSGYPGKIKRVRDICSDLMESGILIPAVATNRYAILHLHDSFKADLGGFEMVAKLLASEPYQEAFKTLAVGDRTKKIDVATLGKFKIPLLPLEKRLLLDLALNEEEVTIQAMLGAMNKALISVDAIRCFTGTPEWRHFSEQASTAPTGELRSELSRLVAIHAKEVLDQGPSQDDPFLDWIRQFTGVADSLEQILKRPLTAEQILSLQQWRGRVADAKSPYESAWTTFREAIELDPEKIRDAVLERSKGVIEAIRTLSLRCERELTQELNASQERERAISEFWEISRGSGLRGTDFFVLPFLLMLAKEPRVQEALEHSNKNAFDAALFELMSRSRTFQTAVQWFKSVQSKIEEPQLWQILKKGRNLWANQGEAGLEILVSNFLQQIPGRGSRFQGEPAMPAEAMAFMIAAAGLTPPGQVYVPYAPGYGFSGVLPAGVEGYFQFRTEHEAGIFAIHEMAAGRHSPFEVSDPTTHWNPLDRRFNAVIAMPPFNQRISRNSDPVEVACIKKALSALSPRGKAVICVNSGFLMRSDRVVRDFRRELVTDSEIEAVIQLPSGILAGSSIAISLLVLRNSERKMQSVRFIDATDCVVSGQRNEPPRLDLAELQKRWHDDSHSKSRSVAMEELERKEFDLTPARYLVAEIMAPDNHTLIRLGDLISQIRFPRCQLGDRGIPLGPRSIPSIGSLDSVSFENHEVIDAEGLTHLENTIRVNKSALIINPIFSRDGLAACLFEHNGVDLFLLRPDMLTFEVKSELVDTQWLLLALGSELTRKQIEALTVGIGIPRVRQSLLLDVKLAVPNQKSQQRALVAFHKESLLKSRAKELGLEDLVHTLKSRFRNELRQRRHNLAPAVNQIKSRIETLSKTLEIGGKISADQIISRASLVSFKDYLQSTSLECEYLCRSVERLAEESLFETPKPLDFIKELRNLAKKHSPDGIKVSVEVDEISFVNPLKNQKIKPIVSIGDGDFKDLFRNIVDNAKRHGFAENPDEGHVHIAVSFLQQQQMLELIFMNNGVPLPEGMDTHRFALWGEKAGRSGNTGIGGYHINSIMEHVGGSLEVLSVPNHSFPVQLKLLFPICYEDTI